MTTTMTIDSKLAPFVELARKITGGDDTIRCQLFSHEAPHSDEAMAARLKVKYASKAFFGISLDTIKFWAKRELPEGKTLEELIAEGQIGLGIWGALDEHARDGKDAAKGHACTSMEYRLLKLLIDEKILILDEKQAKSFEAEQGLVDMVTDVDAHGPPDGKDGRPNDGGFHLEQMRKARVNAKVENKGLIKWLVAALDAVHGAKMARDAGKKAEDKNLFFSGARLDHVQELAAIWLVNRADSYSRRRERIVLSKTYDYDPTKHGPCVATFVAQQLKLSRRRDIGAVLNFLKHAPETDLHGRRIMEAMQLTHSAELQIEWAECFFDALATRVESRLEAKAEVADDKVTQSYAYKIGTESFTAKVMHSDNLDICKAAFKAGADIVISRKKSKHVVLMLGDRIRSRPDAAAMAKEAIFIVRLAEVRKLGKNTPSKGFDADDCSGGADDPQCRWSLYRGDTADPVCWIFNGSPSRPDVTATCLTDEEILRHIKMVFDRRN